MSSITKTKKPFTRGDLEYFPGTQSIGSQGPDDLDNPKNKGRSQSGPPKNGFVEALVQTETLYEEALYIYGENRVDHQAMLLNTNQVSEDQAAILLEVLP